MLKNFPLKLDILCCSLKKNKFGEKAVENIKRMAEIKLPRKIIEERKN